MKPKHIVLWIILPALTVLVGMKFYTQYRHIEINVMRQAPMPALLSNTLHMAEHGIDPVVMIETPYVTAEEKILSMSEIRGIRSRLTWHTTMPVIIDSLTIRSTNSVLARRSTKRMLTEYRLVKTDGEWTIQSANRSQVFVYKPE
jgi:hypothetical protein